MFLEMSGLLDMFVTGERNTQFFVLTKNLFLDSKLNIRKQLLIISLIFIINPVYPCPINGRDKDQFLSELCKIDDGKWSSNRLNEMIILTKFESLPLKATRNGNRILAALTCGF